MIKSEGFLKAALGVLGGLALIIGIFMISPFLGKPEVDFSNPAFWFGAISLSSGAIAVLYSVLSLLEG
ncbi:MAG: hypothetical protein ABEJ56_04590 [Candidatus Nanohaloarchaea archaeon]